MSRALGILILGDKDVGKNSLIEAYNKTTEFKRRIKGKDETILLANGKSQREFSHKKQEYLAHAHCIILCYDLTSEKSYESIKNFWLPQIDELDYYIPIVLCCTKEDNSVLSINDTFSIAKARKEHKNNSNIKYFVTCSSQKEVEGEFKNDGNVQSVFKMAIKLAYSQVNPKVSLIRTFRKSIKIKSLSLSGTPASAAALKKLKSNSSAGEESQKMSVLVLGDKKVGKTNFVRAVAHDEVHEEAYLPKVWEKVTKTVSLNDKDYEVEIIDTGRIKDQFEAEIEEFEDVDAVILCYSVDSKKSWKSITSFWLPKLGKHLPDKPVIICGTKSDCKRVVKSSLVSKEAGLNKKVRVKECLECSARIHREDGGNYDVVLKAAVQAGSEPPQPIKRLFSKIF